MLLGQSYEPYGDVLESAGVGTNSYGFAAEMRDSYIKLIYLRSREYSPATGRFLTQDSWQGDYTRPLSLNGWNYVEADPINGLDPSGRCLDADMDGKCDPGWQCASITDPIAREACWQSVACNTGLCPSPPTGLSESTPFYKAYKRLVETPCEMKGQNLTPWWKTSGARENAYTPVDQTMLVTILVYTEVSPIRNTLPSDPVHEAWIEMAGNRYSYYRAHYGGCGIKDGKELQLGLRLFLSFSPRYADYGYEIGISRLLDKNYGPPTWAYKMAEEIIRPRTPDLNRPFGVFNSQTADEQQYFYAQFLQYGEKSTQREGVYSHWGTAENKKDLFGDMFILTWPQQSYHKQLHPVFPIGGNLTGGL